MEVGQDGKKEKMSHGGRNLVLLGVISTALALLTTGISLLIYHGSGDIYLDRSRPGYLPDEAEIENEGDMEEYSLEKSGKLTVDIVEEYLEKLKVDVEAIDGYEKPFDDNVLSDERLGIPEEKTEK